MRLMSFCLSLLLIASPAAGQQTLGLAAPETVTRSGLLKYILPRFSLKTGIRVVPDDAGPMVLATEPPGQPVFADADTLYYLRSGDDPRQLRFAEWMVSDIGKRTIESFAPDGKPLYSAQIATERVETGPVFTGDAARGARLALRNCGRCHVIGPQNPMAGISSTPSFPALKALSDWAERFQTFYLRNPHPAIIQIEGITTPFGPERPPPIVPLEITPADLEALLAFVDSVPAADLGAPLQFQ